MFDSSKDSPKRILEPYDRLFEILFGLIMVLTFTGSLSIAEAGRDDIRTMLIGALGCNLAWGIIDGVFYFMGCLAERNRGITLLQSIREAPDSATATRTVSNALPPFVVANLLSADLEAVTDRLRRMPPPPARLRLHSADWKGAVGVFVVVFLSTFPVVLPFLFMSDARLALRVSNGIAIAMLFGVGWAFGRLVRQNQWVAGVLLVLLGGALVGLTIALGG